MSEISEERLAQIERDPYGYMPANQTLDALVDDLIDEIRRLRAVIKKRNHCDDCGKLNPVDNVCEECWRNHCE